MSGFYLAVDTATEACSVAVQVNDAYREQFEVVDRGHTQKLLPMIRSVLADCGKTLAQLDGIACGIGPGSFAGVRIGVGVVKGLALARDLPVVGVSSLAMLGLRAMRASGVAQVAAVIDARMNEVYFGAYARASEGLVAVIQDQLGAAQALPALPAGEWVGVGTGWAVHEAPLRAALKARIAAVDPAALPHAEDALRLALPEFAAGRAASADALAPAYLRDRVALTLAEQSAQRR